MSSEFSSDGERMEPWASTAKLRRIEVKRIEALLADSSVPAGDTMAKVFLKAIQPSRTLPNEVRVRSQKYKDSLAPLMKSFGVTVRVASRLPVLDEAKAHLLDFLGGR